MTTTIDAVFDGRVFLPVQPIALPPNTHVRLAITTEDSPATVSFLDVAESLALEGPEDWSLQLDTSTHKHFHFITFDQTRNGG